MQTGVIARHNNILNTTYPVSANLKGGTTPTVEASDFNKIATIEDSLEDLRNEKSAIDKDLENLQKSFKVKLANKLEGYVLPILGATALGGLGVLLGGFTIPGAMLPGFIGSFSVLMGGIAAVSFTGGTLQKAGEKEGALKLREKMLEGRSRELEKEHHRIENRIKTSADELVSMEKGINSQHSPGVIIDERDSIVIGGVRLGKAETSGQLNYLSYYF